MKTYYITFNPNICFEAEVRANSAEEAVEKLVEKVNPYGVKPVLSYAANNNETPVQFIRAVDAMEADYYVYFEGNDTGEPDDIIVY